MTGKLPPGLIGERERTGNWNFVQLGLADQSGPVILLLRLVLFQQSVSQIEDGEENQEEYEKSQHGTECVPAILLSKSIKTIF